MPGDAPAADVRHFDWEMAFVLHTKVFMMLQQLEADSQGKPH